MTTLRNLLEDSLVGCKIENEVQSVRGKVTFSGIRWGKGTPQENEKQFLTPTTNLIVFFENW